MLEAIDECERISGKKLKWTYVEDNRIGDHIWWISNTGKFKSHYPDWKQNFDVRGILQDIYEKNAERWQTELK
jgi:CDP-paratose 2-epimerase